MSQKKIRSEKYISTKSIPLVSLHQQLHQSHHNHNRNVCYYYDCYHDEAHWCRQGSRHSQRNQSPAATDYSRRGLVQLLGVVLQRWVQELRQPISSVWYCITTTTSFLHTGFETGFYRETTLNTTTFQL